MAEKLSNVRTRFAPSPTGFVHIGSLRTALFSFLFARHHGGTHVLRVEDTDQAREVEGALENLLRVMHTMGIEFDEGFYLDGDHPNQRGDFGPYLQSERLPQYQKTAQQLVEQGSAYYCFCSEQRLEDLRKEQVALKKPPMYDRHCRILAKEEVAKQLEEFKSTGKNPVIRQAIPVEGKTIVPDLIYGDITFDHSVIDDQVLLKSDGFPTYHLAVVVDDHAMKISHVIRGEEWINSTPKHILLYQSLQWTAPAFAHLPLILNPDKSKLSKRQGDVSVEDFLAKGYLPEALLNFVAFLGWNPKTEQELFSLKELIEQFDLSKVNKAGAIFDLNKLDWMNGLYLRQLNDKQLAELLKPHWQNAGVTVANFKDEYLTAIAGLEKERLKKLSEIGERTAYFFSAPDCDANLLVWKKSTAEDAKAKLQGVHDLLSSFSESDFARENLEAKLKDFIAQNGGGNGSVLWPLRVALTGQEKSPGPFEVAATIALGLGKDEILKRLQNAIAKL
jgi:glutamyl-tRNA synthetase